MLATKALGVDRTYFGVELGFCKPKWITAIPYNAIPHPMIVSQIFALLGFFKAVQMRESFVWLVPIHIMLYPTHMLQEVFGIHKKCPGDQRTPTNAATPKKQN